MKKYTIIYQLQRALGSSYDKLGKSMKRGLKKIPEIGKRFSKDVQFPEVFYQKRPAIVPNCWIKPSEGEKIKAAFFTPFKKIKRKIFK